MIIELCGLPGVGKTTLAKNLEQAHEAEVVLLSGKLETLYYVLKGFLLQPGFYIRGLWWCARHDWRPYFMWNFFCVRYAKVQKARHCPSALVLIDEGIMQNLLSYSSHTHDLTELLYFKEYLATIDQVVCVTVTEPERHAQILKRDMGKTNERRQANEERDRVMMSNLELLKQLCSEQDHGLVTDAKTAAMTLTTSFFNHS